MSTRNSRKEYLFGESTRYSSTGQSTRYSSTGFKIILIEPVFKNNNS